MVPLREPFDTCINPLQTINALHHPGEPRLYKLYSKARIFDTVTIRDSWRLLRFVSSSMFNRWTRIVQTTHTFERPAMLQ